MNRKLIGLAAAALVLPAAVQAQQSSVTLYGRLNIDAESVRAGSPGAPSVTRITNNSSLFGLRGEENLGDGLRALFQIENSVSLDSGAGSIAGRNSGVGLAGPLGTVIVGQWDTPYKAATTRLDPFGDTTIAGYGAVLYGNASNTAANAANRNSFDRRQRNVVQYWSPTAAGLSGRAAWGVGEEKGTCAVACDPRLLSAALAWEDGPVFMTAAWEQHDDYANTASANTRDRAWKLAAAWSPGDTTLALLAERLEFEGNLAATGLPKTFTAGSAREVRLDTLWLSATRRFGAHSLRLATGRSRDLRLDGAGAAGTGARYFALGHAYALSPRTSAYALFTRIDNGGRSRNDFAINGIGGLRDGAAPRGLGVGLVHTF